MTKIAVLFGSPKISGGSYVILQHVEYLMKRGHAVDLITLEPVLIEEDDIWHDALKTIRFVEIGRIGNEKYDIALATWWISPFHLHRIDAKQYAYFVQSIEALFFDDSKIASQYLAHASYALGLPVITEAEWIRKDLELRFHSDVFLVENGIRKDIYKPHGPKIADKVVGKLRCLIEGSVTSPFKNIARTVDAVRTSNADEIWLLTPSEIDSYPHVDRVFSKVPIHDVPRIYRSCDVLVKQSFVEGMFGPPLEMFHCGGTAVVSNVTGFDQYIKDDFNALVTDVGEDQQVTNAINKLCSNSYLLRQLQAGAQKTALAWPDWHAQSSLFETAIQEICRLPSVSRERLAVNAQHCLNQYSLIRKSLSEHFEIKSNSTKYVANDDKNNLDPSLGATLYYQQKSQPFQPATRLTNAPNMARKDIGEATRRFSTSLSKTGSVCMSKSQGRTRVFGFSISNEHIEEMYHPIVLKADWDALYMCTRPKGYFSLGYINPPKIPDEKYIVSNWINDPTLLYQSIEEFGPNLILFHNGNHPAYQDVLKSLKSRFNIPIAFSELGWFPQKGNIYFDPWGTNGASRLCALSIEDLTHADIQQKDAYLPLHSKSILLALQLENDTNTILFSPHFRSNRDLIENVIASVPVDYEILIKPHPLDHNAHYYEKFSSDRAKIVSDPIPDLLSRVGSVIAINSTVLLQAMDYPVNIYSCGRSILSNKGISISFTEKNLKNVWRTQFLDNKNRRDHLKHALSNYQFNIEKIDYYDRDSFLSNPSIKLLLDLIDHGSTSIQDTIVVQSCGGGGHKIATQGSRHLVGSMREVMTILPKYEVISFDVFDTLLVRDIYEPCDIFSYNSRQVISLIKDSKFDHRKTRIEAEEEARSYNSEKEITIHDIYIHYLLKTGFPADIVECIKEIEIETELRFLRARKSVREVFNYAKSIQKKIVIISDFYIGSEFVRDALEREGYDLTGIPIYVSCEFGITKKRGDLYDRVAADLKISPSRFLHVGDNFAVDTTNAMKFGYDVVHIPSPRTSLEISPHLKQFLNLDINTGLSARRTLEQSIVLGILNNGLFDDHFEADLNSVFGSSHSRFGFIALGPLLVGFVTWLREQVRLREVGTLLFLARDGWVIERAFRLYQQISKDKVDVDFAYIAASRRITDIVSCGLDFSNINNIVSARFSSNSLSYFLKLRFDLDESAVTSEELSVAGYKNTAEIVSLPQDKIRVLKLLQVLRPKIEKKSKEILENYKEYIGNFSIRPCSPIGLVDIGYFGSMQKTLSQILGDQQTVFGFYLATRGEAKNDPQLKNHMFGYLADGFELSDNFAPKITAHLIFLEQIFSAPHSSVSGVTKHGKVLNVEYLASTGEDKQWEYLKLIHEGALEFVREFTELTVRLGEKQLEMERLDYTTNFAELLDGGNNEVAELFKNFVLENFFNGEGMMLLGKKYAKKTTSTRKVPTPETINSKPKSSGEQEYIINFDTACMLYHRQQYDSALSHAERALNLQPRNANLRRVLAEILLKKGHRKEAIFHLENAHLLVPENRWITKRLRYIKYPLLGWLTYAKPFPVPNRS